MPSIASFTFNTAPGIEFGTGKIQTAAPRMAAVLGPRAVLITDAGMMATGLVDPLLLDLRAEGCDPVTYSEVEADPPEIIVIAAAEAARAAGATGIIGFGGGSSLDVAKLAALLAAGPTSTDLRSIYGVGNATGPRLPLVLVPTTSGTGSEVTPVAIVTTGAAEKMGVVSPVILPDLAVLDPELTHGLPPMTTAATGIDAMVHAIEAYASASPNNNPLSRMLACEALRLMGPALERAVQSPTDAAARADMLLGSMLAGQAFANSPVAAVHALAYPIGGHFDIPHGVSNALVLPHVLRFNAEVAPHPYAELAPLVFPHLDGQAPDQAAAIFANALAELSARCGLPSRLRDVGVGEDAIDMMARDAMNQTRLLVNNPRAVSEADARAIYRAAW